MCGPGSGRHWHWGSKNLTFQYISIDVRRWLREGFLEPGRTFGWRWVVDGEVTSRINAHVSHGEVRLNYRVRDYSDEWEAMSYPVRLLSTECHFGGDRRWFRCPAQGCGRRVAILYGGRVFACRKCHQLAYPSQRETDYQRYQRKAAKISDRLGWEDCDGEYLCGKPKGMHLRTYNRLVAEYHAREKRSDTALIAHFGQRFAHLLD